MDDAVDEVVPESEWAGGLSDEARAKATERLAGWRAELAATYEGTPRTPQGWRCSRYLREFNLPRARFEELVDGVEMDLRHARYDTFAALVEYCRRVASAVGLICLEIFGYRNQTGQGLCREPRAGAAADQHHSRRRADIARGRDLPADRRSGPVRREEDDLRPDA